MPDGSRNDSIIPLFLYCTILTWLCVTGILPAVSAETEPVQAKQDGENDYQRMAGRWVRPDGGYVLELRDIKSDGSLKGAYFNPRPIKVFRAKWSSKEGKLNLYVELRDINYPGSKYNLQYDTTSDRLLGTYYQAVERQTYAVEFVRIK